MSCAWQAFIGVLPIWMRQSIENYKDNLQELRLRLDMPPEIIIGNNTIWLERAITNEDLRYCINVASQYSPWAAETIKHGYLTCPGGHRIGVCGEVIYDKDNMKGIHSTTSLCIRIARDFPNMSLHKIPLMGSILIIGKPGSGKTTLLRSIIRRISNSQPGSIAVIDERREIFPYYRNTSCFPPGKRTDILSGCRKTHGIEIALRCMGPSTIAVDEITAEDDCSALIHAGWCGVNLIATAHAGCRKDLFERKIYSPIIQSKLFDTVVILHEDKSWNVERLNV